MEKAEIKKMFDSVIGKGCGPRSMKYTWRDVALYALAVGCSKDDLPYIYEHNPNFKVLPTFSLLPYLNSILMEPRRIVPYAPNEVVGDAIIEARNGDIPNRLHMAMELTIHKPLNPIEGTLLTEDKVEKVYDWGPKGIVATTAMDIYDLAGNPVSSLRSTHYHAAFGDFGGEPYKSPSMPYPAQEPEFKLNGHLADNQAVLYRLLGDTYNTHIDLEITRKYGYKGCFLQGLCTLGFATRMVIQHAIPYQAERVTHVYGQLRSVAFPDSDVQLQGWEIEPGKILYKLFDSDGNLLVGNGLVEYK